MNQQLQKAYLINHLIQKNDRKPSGTSYTQQPQRKQEPEEGYNPIMRRIYTINRFLLEGMNRKNTSNFILESNPDIEQFANKNLDKQTERYKKMFRHMSKIDVLHVDKNYVEAFLKEIEFKMEEIPEHPGSYKLLVDNKKDAFQVVKDMIPKRTWSQWYSRTDDKDFEDTKEVLRAVQKEDGAEFRHDVYNEAEKAAELDKGGKKSKIAKKHKASKKRRASKKRKTKTSRK